MVMIYIKHVVDSADTADQGSAVFDVISKAFTNNENIVISFDDVTTATSSFVNTAFVPLLNIAPISILKRRLKIVQSTRQINHMIKLRLEKEAGRYLAA